MGFYRAVLQRENGRRADYIEDVTDALASLFDGKLVEKRIRDLRKRD